MKNKLLAAVAALIVAMFFGGCSFGSSNGDKEGSSPPPNASVEQPDSSQSGGEGESPDSSGEESEDSGSSSGEQIPTEPEDVPDVPVLTWNGESAEISWSDVGAEVYIVYIDGEQVEITSKLSAKIDVTAHGVYLAEVRAYAKMGGEGYSSQTIECPIKAKPPSVSANVLELTWQAVEGADHYVVYMDGAYITQVRGLAYTASNTGNYSVAAVFEDERLNSDKSEPVMLYAEEFLVAPSEVRIEDDVICWKAVGGATHYKLYIGDKVVAVEYKTDCAFRSTYNLMYKKDHPDGVNITVVACADGKDDSPHSDPVFFK